MYQTFIANNGKYEINKTYCGFEVWEIKDSELVTSFDIENWKADISDEDFIELVTDKCEQEDINIHSMISFKDLLKNLSIVALDETVQTITEPNHPNMYIESRLMLSGRTFETDFEELKPLARQLRHFYFSYKENRDLYWNSVKDMEVEDEISITIVESSDLEIDDPNEFLETIKSSYPYDKIYNNNMFKENSLEIVELFKIEFKKQLPVINKQFRVISNQDKNKDIEFNKLTQNSVIEAFMHYMMTEVYKDDIDMHTSIIEACPNMLEHTKFEKVELYNLAIESGLDLDDPITKKYRKGITEHENNYEVNLEQELH